MEEKNSLYAPYHQQSASVTKTDPVRDLWKLSAGNYREREEEALAMKQKLPPDHLTAIYWG